MRTVHKFPIEPAGNGWFEVELPVLATPRLVASQMGKLNMWVDLYTEHPRVTRRFQIVPTGYEVADGLQHVCSFLTNNGAAVWHIFEAGQ